jgi:hypothetical protein
MSADPAAQPSGPDEGPDKTSGAPTEEELRAAYEAELSRITSADMMLQAAVSLLNIGGSRLGPIGDRQADGESRSPAGTAATGSPAGPERDLEQVRDAIDGVRALLGILERRLPGELRPLRDALSQLQMAYAREAQKSAGDAMPGASEALRSEPGARPRGAPAGQQGRAQPAEEKNSPSEREQPDGPGPAESSGRLWVPGR